MCFAVMVLKNVHQFKSPENVIVVGNVRVLAKHPNSGATYFLSRAFKFFTFRFFTFLSSHSPNLHHPLPIYHYFS